MKKLLCIISVLLLTNCSKKQEVILPRLKSTTTQKGILINSKEMLQSRSPLFAINFKSDTTILKNPNEIADETNSVGHNFNDTLPNLKALKVYVDTRNPINTTGFLYKNIKRRDASNPKMKTGVDYRIIEQYYDELEKLAQTPVACYPVLVFNTSNQPQQLDRPHLNSGFNMIQEALDTDGRWKPIEFMFDFVMCGTGHYDFKIAPKQYVASGILVYDGDFETKLRVRVNANGSIYYSNEFDGKINRSQFSQDFLPQFLKDNGRWFDGKGYYYEGTLALMFLDPVPKYPSN